MSIKCKLDMERQHGAPGRELRVAQEETTLMLAVLVVSCADNCGAASGEPREAVDAGLIMKVKPRQVMKMYSIAQIVTLRRCLLTRWRFGAHTVPFR
jgi:hypothetical protein